MSIFDARWIWNKQKNYKPYNQTIIAKKSFTAQCAKTAKICITADSFYRLYINECWINDGPCKCWPEHYQFDEIDVVNFLNDGFNTIRIVATHFGIGEMRRIPRHAGLLVYLEIEENSGPKKCVISDKTWQISEANSWIKNTPKISIQMEPAELYDARMEQKLRFMPAHELFGATDGPWKNLHRRDVALLNKKPLYPISVVSAQIVNNSDMSFCIPVAKLMHPGIIEANMNTGTPCAFATCINLKKKSKIKISAEGVRKKICTISIDGRSNFKGEFTLTAGSHIIIVFVPNLPNHDKDISIRFIDPPKMRLFNPLDDTFKNPWCFVPFSEFAYCTDDVRWIWFTQQNVPIQELIDKYQKMVKKLIRVITNVKQFRDELSEQAICLTNENMFVNDSYSQFLHRNVLFNAMPLVDKPASLMHDTSEMTTVFPNSKGDVELIYDFGQQCCGYYCFDLISEDGVEIDFYGVEYLDKLNMPQHTIFNRNGMRYVTKKGINRFISLKRRSGRYIFITLRNQKKPVQIKTFHVIESTYPVEHIGNFRSSNAELNAIWNISARTQELCMEDTFTDCPLYEQTLWIGDARNEALFAYALFGAYDLAKRGILLAAHSLDHLPMIAAQVPSSWKCIIPAWSFLWGISVWDYYWHTGDKPFLKYIWKYVIKNLKGAEQFTKECGLFSAPTWNMFDWADIDTRHKTVLHNSMFFVGAINAAMKCAHELNDIESYIWLKGLSAKLRNAINHCWDDKAKAYPDSIHDDGKVSSSHSLHTSILAFLYDIVDKHKRPYVLKDIVSPRKKLVKIGSPFALHYLFEAHEQLHLEKGIIQTIINNYTPMLKNDATSVWEGFPGSSASVLGFLTRSHCHGWSCAPVYFFNRIILGVRQTSVGGKTFSISPWIEGLKWARGTVATQKGPLSVAWEIHKNVINLDITVPPNSNVTYVSNASHRNFKVSKTIRNRY